MWTRAVVLTLVCVVTVQAQTFHVPAICGNTRPCPVGFRCQAPRVRCGSSTRCPNQAPTCVAVNASCQEPLKIGLCKALIYRYFYNTTSQQCEKFGWGGCSPNGNNFLTLNGCQKKCLPGGGSSCLVEGIWYPDGFPVNDDPCSPCTCSNGSLVCLAIDCFFPPPCANPVVPPGQCCAVCPTNLDPKPGQCSRRQYGICAVTCNRDSECSGEHKCCPTNCGGTSCQPPATTCDDVQCPSGTYCTMQSQACDVSPCPPAEPRCIKSGLCPAWPVDRPRIPVDTTQCAKRCSSDTQCPGEQKCCRGQGEGRPPCGYSCQDPIFV